ncbi:MAG: nucleotidyltransferase family protein, partial [Saprospiraceae bacterium]|nr:nucleotidyltransferase family protein [Saprospiraceae bacterium]
QRELLRACLLPPGEALPAYRRWLGRVDIQRLDHGSNRLLGLLYRNLSRAGEEFPHAALLKGNWRYHWVQNQTRVREVAGILRKMAEAGLPVMLLKGAALLDGYYKDYGSRPMADVDLLVPEQRAGERWNGSGSGGYLPLRHSAEAIRRSLRYNHALHLRKEGAVDIDLHWFMQHDGMSPGADDAVWERSKPSATFGPDCRCRAPLICLSMFARTGCGIARSRRCGGWRMHGSS